MYGYVSTLSSEGKNLSQAVQTVNPKLEKISLWLYRSQFILSVLEAHCMVFHKPRNDQPNTLDLLFIGRIEVEGVFEIRCQGVNLDPCFKC